MPIHERWLDETKKIILIERDGEISREEHQKSFDNMMQLSTSVPYLVGAIVIDRRDHRSAISVRSMIIGGSPLDKNSKYHIAIIITIQSRSETASLSADDESINAYAMETLSRYSNRYVGINMIIGLDEAKEIILNHLAKLD